MEDYVAENFRETPVGRQLDGGTPRLELSVSPCTEADLGSRRVIADWQVKQDKRQI